MPDELQRTVPQKKAKELSKYIRGEKSDYNYLKSVFKYLRKELEIGCFCLSPRKGMLV